EQMPVNTVADPERKNAGVRIFLDLRDYFVLVADISVCHKTNDAEMCSRRGRFKCGHDGLHHFRTAAALARCQKFLSGIKIRTCCRNGFVKQNMRVAGERY